MGGLADPKLTGVPFNDAYRYMDWLLTVPMLLMEIVLVMKLSSEEASQKCISLGLSSALMIVVGYPGELIVEGDLSQRWMYWMLALLPFMYIVYELLVGLAAATASETGARLGLPCSVGHSGELVDVPRRLRLPHAGLRRGPGGREHPGGILRVGRHLQVRCWAHYLQHHCRQVRRCQAGAAVARPPLTSRGSCCHR